MITNNIGEKVFQADESKCIQNSSINNVNDIFSNMIVDHRAIKDTPERIAVKNFVKHEFGENFKFSESFIDKVLERLQN